MSMPEQIDPFRALALCFGVELPPAGKHAGTEAIDRLCDYLDISPVQRRRLSKSFALLRKALRELASNQEWLDLPEHMSSLHQTATRCLALLDSELKTESRAKLHQALDSPRLPQELLDRLLPAFLRRMSPPSAPADRPRAFCRKLIELDPRAFSRALLASEREPAPSTAAEPLDISELQKLARTMDRLQQAVDGDHPKRAVDDALKAWDAAFEHSILKTCLFLWYAAQPLSTPQERLVPPQGAASRNHPNRKPEIKKGQVFQEARDWCARQGLGFPFHPHLDKLRNAIAHGDYTILTDSVELRGQGGVIDTIPHDRLVERVHDDLEFALYFHQGANEAWLADSERSDASADAWATAVQLLPELATATRAEAPRSSATSSTRRRDKAQRRAAETTKLPPIDLTAPDRPMLANPATADIFEILSVKERENTYTSLLAYLLKTSEALRAQLIQYAFTGAHPPAASFAVTRQASLDPKSIVDILLEATDDARQRWALFVEAKIHASELGDQTPRYRAACEKRVGSEERVGGVFLTLTGHRARRDAARALEHRKLADWIDDRSADFGVNPVLQAAAAAYVARARVELPEAEDDTRLKTLLTRQDGLVPRLAGADAIARACTAGLADTWETWSVQIQGRGHANPGLIFRQPEWVGPAELEQQWTPDNYNLHLELELIAESKWRLKLHFETNPYLPKRKLAEIRDHKKFYELRDKFRKLLAAKLDTSSGWRPKGKELQIAVYKLPIGHDPTVGQLRSALAPALAYIAPLVASSLAKARASSK